MKTLEQEKVVIEIVELHNQINDEILKITESILSKVLEIGERLDAKKEELGHGNFTKWIDSELANKISTRTVRLYMQIYKNKDRLVESEIKFLSLRAIVKYCTSKKEVKQGDTIRDILKDYLKTGKVEIRYKEALKEHLWNEVCKLEAKQNKCEELRIQYVKEYQKLNKEESEPRSKVRRVSKSR